GAPPARPRAGPRRGGGPGRARRRPPAAAPRRARPLTAPPRTRLMELRPEYDGTTTVAGTTEVDFPIGTRVEINLGPALPADSAALAWAQLACELARGSVYAGRSSPWWYDAPQFHELACAAGTRPLPHLLPS